MAETLVAAVADEIPLLPTIRDSAGRAWKLSPAALDALVLWLVEAPWAHPYGHSYLLSLARCDPTRRRRLADPDAAWATTHEIVLFALDPTRPRAPLVCAPSYAGLGVASFAGQFSEDAAGEALARVQLAVRAICAGLLSPVSTHRTQWQALFGGNLID